MGGGSGPLGGPIGAFNSATDSGTDGGSKTADSDGKGADGGGGDGSNVTNANADPQFFYYNDPMGAGSADPMKSLDKKVYLIFRKVAVICAFKSEQRVRIQAEGHLKSQDGVSRILRIVDIDDKEYIDIQSDPTTGYVSFETITGNDLEMKLFVMPKDFVPGPLNTTQACQSGSCAPGGKRPEMWNYDLFDTTIDNAPECPPLPKEIDKGLHQTNDPKMTPLDPAAGPIHL
jgi:hypothetical protein